MLLRLPICQTEFHQACDDYSIECAVRIPTTHHVLDLQQQQLRNVACEPSRPSEAANSLTTASGRTCGALNGLDGPQARGVLSRQPIHQRGRVDVQVLHGGVVGAAAPRRLEGCRCELQAVSCSPSPLLASGSVEFRRTELSSSVACGSNDCNLHACMLTGIGERHVHNSVSQQPDHDILPMKC